MTVQVQVPSQIRNIDWSKQTQNVKRMKMQKLCSQMLKKAKQVTLLFVRDTLPKSKQQQENAVIYFTLVERVAHAFASKLVLFVPETRAKTVMISTTCAQKVNNATKKQKHLHQRINDHLNWRRKIQPTLILVLCPFILGFLSCAVFLVASLAYSVT